MKLSHLTIAVSVALGLAACGGSSDDAVDNSTGNHSGGVQPGGNGGNTGTQPDTGNDSDNKPSDTPDTVKNPENRKNAITVEKRIEATVAANKKAYLNRAARNTLAGYQQPNPTGEMMRYIDGSTDEADILRASSIVNYAKENLVNENGSLRLNPLQTYAMGKDGQYYRIVRPLDANGNPISWEDATVTSTFKAVRAGDAQFGNYGGNDNIPFNALVFIPNVATADAQDQGPGKQGATEAFIPSQGTLGDGIVLDKATQPGLNVVNPKNIDFSDRSGPANVFDTTRGQVALDSVEVAGSEYNLRGGANSVPLDLSGVKVAEEIQKLPITLNYSINDTKSTQSLNDDDVLQKSAKAGELRVYNLNYSRALLEVNQAAAEDSTSVDAALMNGLGFSNARIFGKFGATQVDGFRTATLPTNGRAQYTGKSFGVNSEGDINLQADFGVDRASIQGSVVNRVDGKGVALGNDIVLNEILLSQPGQYSVTGSKSMNPTANTLPGLQAVDGLANIGTTIGTWAVQLYGPNAENAAGVIAVGNTQEVFNSARGDINPKSLNN